MLTPAAALTALAAAATEAATALATLPPNGDALFLGHPFFSADPADLVPAPTATAPTAPIFDANALRPFEKSDWYGWAGATASPNGNGPLIGHDVSGDAYTVIVDALGVEVTLYRYAKGDDEWSRVKTVYRRDTVARTETFESDASFGRAVIAALALGGEPLTPANLTTLGYKDVTP